MDLFDLLKIIEKVDKNFEIDDKIWHHKTENPYQLWQNPHDLFHYFKRPDSERTIKGTCLPRKFATIGRHEGFRADKGK